jgi:hypothetical protein
LDTSLASAVAIGAGPFFLLFALFKVLTGLPNDLVSAAAAGTVRQWLAVRHIRTVLLPAVSSPCSSRSAS